MAIPTSQDVSTLAKYFRAAHYMFQQFGKELDVIKDDPKYLEPWGEAALAHPTLIAAGFWYSALYVVIEGWQELSLTDPSIDPLLASPLVQTLKRSWSVPLPTELQ